MNRKAGTFKSSNHSYRFCKKCGLEYVPIKQWAVANFFSVKQCRRFLRDGNLYGMRHLGKIFVAANPDNPPSDDC